jgi:hypothetical protein
MMTVELGADDGGKRAGAAASRAAFLAVSASASAVEFGSVMTANADLSCGHAVEANAYAVGACVSAKADIAKSYILEVLEYDLQRAEQGLPINGFAALPLWSSAIAEDIELMVNIRLGTEQTQRHYGLGKVLPRRRLLFVVDDLDRCSPEGIFKTFEAIRLVLDLPQVIVVVAVDQRIALAALALHYEKLTKHHQLNDAKAISIEALGICMLAMAIYVLLIHQSSC